MRSHPGLDSFRERMARALASKHKEAFPYDATIEIGLEIFFYKYSKKICFCWTPKRGSLYTEQNHLHGQRREFRLQNNTQKTKENDVKMILISLAYLTPIRLSICMSTGERERIFIKKKEKKKNRS